MRLNIQRKRKRPIMYIAQLAERMTSNHDVSGSIPDIQTGGVVRRYRASNLKINAKHTGWGLLTKGEMWNLHLQ